MADSPCFGIDLGTSCSTIGWVKNGRPTLIPVDGQVLMPSVVAFPPEQAPLVGLAAQNSLHLYPAHTILSSKRKMGTDHVYDLGHRKVTPTEIASLLLKHLAEAAEKETGIKPQRVVITVPAWFTQAQRADTRRAGADAGLDVVRIVNEPTAAALAHAHGQDQRRRVLVYDLGGGTFDVSLVEQDGPVLEVKASHGDTMLGGDDVDRALVEVMTGRLLHQDRPLHDAIEASQSAQILLKFAAEKAKIQLTQTLKAQVAVPFIARSPAGEPLHLETSLRRQDLDQCVADIIERTLKSVDQVLTDAQTKAENIDELLLVGGSTYLPQVWHALKEHYGLDGSHAIPPQLAVGLGAAIQAAIVDGSRTDGVLVDVAPYPISVGVASGTDYITQFVTQVITPRNATLPSRHTEIFYTLSPDQDEFIIPVFQGSHPDPRRNVFLGEVRMDGIDPAPKGYRQRPVSVEFRHDLNGMINILVTDELSGRSAVGAVAADGAQQVEQRRAWLEKLFEDGEVLFGEDLEPSWGDIDEDAERVSARQATHEAQELADEAEEVVDEDADDGHASGQSPALRAELEDARVLFQRVLDSRAQILSQHPRQAAQLEALARQGLDALDMSDAALAMEHFDTLSDDMFNLGLYL